MRIQRTFYEVMGLEKNATQAEVKAKYHALARQFHPDRAKDKELGQRLFTQINLAYRTLSDPARRADYDGSLQQASGAVKTSGTATPSSAARSSVSQAKTDPLNTRTTQPVGQRGQNIAPGPGQLTLDQALQKANGAYMSGDRRTAQQLCQNIVRADSGNAAAHVLLGDIFSDLGQRVEALTEYRTAVNAGDNSRLVLEKIKRLETQSGQPIRPPSNNTQRPTAPPGSSSQKKPPDPPKKTGFFDRIIGRGKN